MVGKPAKDRAVKRRALITAATRTLAARGSQSATLDLVCAELGKSTGYAHNYFRSKALMVRGVINRHFDGIYAALDAADPALADAGAEPTADLQALAQAYLGYLVGAGADGHQVVAHLLHDPASGLRADLLSMRARLATLFADALERERGDMRADPDRAFQLARLLLVVLDGLAEPGEAAELPEPAAAAGLAVAFVRSAPPAPAAVLVTAG